MALYNIQWLTFISLCACLAVIYLTQRNQDRQEEALWGLGKGIVALLGQWIGLSAFLASAQASYQYGFIGMVGYSAAGVISYLLLYLLMAKAKKPRPVQPQVLEFLYRLEGTLVAVLAGKMILHLIYDWNATWSIAAVMLFFLLILLLRIGNRYQASFVIVLLSMAATMLLPTLVYLKVSVPTVYSGAKFLATEMLRLDLPESWFLAAALLIRFFAHGLMSPAIHEIYRRIKPAKRGPSFVLSPLFWSFLPLAFGSLAFVAKAEAVWPILPDETSILVVGHFGGQLGVALLSVTLMLILLATMARHMTEGNSEGPRADLFKRAVMILLAGGIALIFPALTILDTMLYFALLWASVTPAALMARPLRGISLLAVAAGLAAGIYYTRLAGITSGVLADFAASLGVMSLFSIRTKHGKGGMWRE